MRRYRLSGSGPTKVKVLSHVDAKFVDPETVNSTVRVSLETILWDNGTTDFEGTVSFGDCTRVISWDGYSGGQEKLLAKVDRTIEVLRKARDALLMHQVVAERFKDDYKKAQAAKLSKKKPKRKGKRKAKR